MSSYEPRFGGEDLGADKHFRSRSALLSRGKGCTPPQHACLLHCAALHHTVCNSLPRCMRVRTGVCMGAPFCGCVRAFMRVRLRVRLCGQKYVCLFQICTHPCGGMQTGGWASVCGGGRACKMHASRDQSDFVCLYVCACA